MLQKCLLGTSMRKGRGRQRLLCELISGRQKKEVGLPLLKLFFCKKPGLNFVVLDGTFWHRIKNIDLETERPGFKSELYYLLAVRLREICVTSLCLSFVICKFQVNKSILVQLL